MCPYLKNNMCHYLKSKEGEKNMKVPEVTLDNIKDARARIRDKVNKTPCIFS